MKSAKDQKSGGMAFDGMEPSSTRGSTRYSGNQWSGHSNDGRLVNKGRGPTVAGQTGKKTPGSVGGVPAVPAQGSVRDSINRGSQVRNPGGTTQVKCPPNPDKIRVGQTGGPDYGGTTKGSKPANKGGQTDFNYGPRSQY